VFQLYLLTIGNHWPEDEKRDSRAFVGSRLLLSSGPVVRKAIGEPGHKSWSAPILTSIGGSEDRQTTFSHNKYDKLSSTGGRPSERTWSTALSSAPNEVIRAAADSKYGDSLHNLFHKQNKTDDKDQEKKTASESTKLQNAAAKLQNAAAKLQNTSPESLGNAKMETTFNACPVEFLPASANLPRICEASSEWKSSDGADTDQNYSKTPATFISSLDINPPTKRCETSNAIKSPEESINVTGFYSQGSTFTSPWSTGRNIALPKYPGDLHNL